MFWFEDQLTIDLFGYLSGKAPVEHNRFLVHLNVL